ncbi:MAG: hypothetical protein WAN35_11000 [Terracidiphilus sp.]
MKTKGCFSRLSKQQPSPAKARRIAVGIAIILFLMAKGIAAAQLPAPGAKMDVPDGYKAHQTVDIGGHVVGLSGSGAMYDTLVNTQSGPRVLGESFELRALPGNTHSVVDSLHAFGNGFGGDPNSFAKLTFEKGKLYEFSGTFRRDRQYFDYDLLGNPNITTGQSIPIGPAATSTTSLAWPQVNHSSVMYNTVRRMTDTNLTLLPLAKVTIRVGYAQNVFQGPTLSPSYTIAKYNALLQEFQRNSTDEFTGGLDWKPVRGTKLSFEAEITHFKTGSYFTLDPNGFTVQEADGTPAYLGNWDSQTAYAIAACNKTSMINNTTILYPNASGMPIIDPACGVVTSYTRTAPTRILTPTGIIRLQSSSIKNVMMNGDFRYTKANMNLPNYYESFQGLNTAARSITYVASASAWREVVSGDYGFVWQATRTLSLADQVDYSNVHQPGTAMFTTDTTLSTPVTAGSETINYTGKLTATSPATGTALFGASPFNTPYPADFGQKLFTNNLTGSWEATSRMQLSLTYRYRTHRINEGLDGTDNAPLAPGATNNGDVTINENGAIVNAAFHPIQNWSINGTVEALYDDNAFTPVGPRQTRHYRVHTLYRPKPWATISGAYNDLERHNNTNNNQVTTALFVPASATPAPNGTAASGTPYEGPLQHVDYSRVFSVGAVVAPNEHYGLDLDYAYSDVYASTNICYLNGATATLPGAVQTATSTPCPNVFGRGSTGATEISGTALSDWFAKDFSDAPTQYLSAAILLSPNDKIHSTLGYRISDVNGSRFFNDARDVNGSLVSKYQSPFVSLAWTIHTGLIFKTEYNYFGYGEGGPSGSPYCSTATSATATVVPCTSATISAYPTGLTETSAGLTAPRNFHANNLTVGMHYEF